MSLTNEEIDRIITAELYDDSYLYDEEIYDDYEDDYDAYPEPEDDDE